MYYTMNELLSQDSLTSKRDFKVGKEHETPDGIDYGDIVAFIYNFNILIQMIKNVRGTRNFGC